VPDLQPRYRPKSCTHVCIIMRKEQCLVGL
jgi:hypothetical protein